MTPVEQALKARGIVGPLVCGDCHACCRCQHVLLDPDELDKEYEVSVQPNGLVELCHKQDGSCVYLGPKGCIIYPYRLRVCREFDCRLVEPGAGPLAEIGREKRLNGWRQAKEAKKCQRRP